MKKEKRTIKVETHNDGLRIETRTLTIPEALAELQAKLDAGTLAGCFKIAEALLVAAHDDEDGFRGQNLFQGQKSLARIPARNGVNDSLVDRLNGVNANIRSANARAGAELSYLARAARAVRG